MVAETWFGGIVGPALASSGFEGAVEWQSYVNGGFTLFVVAKGSSIGVRLDDLEKWDRRLELECTKYPSDSMRLKVSQITKDRLTIKWSKPKNSFITGSTARISP
jgi:hypothetical protein